MLSYELCISFLGLTGLLLILSIDNAIFISILASRITDQTIQADVRKKGLLLSLVTNILLLSVIGFIRSLTTPCIIVGSFALSGQDIILLGGGLTLIAKATSEIHDKLEGSQEHTIAQGAVTSKMVLFNIGILNFVFSIDSVLTAVGMADSILVMTAAIVTSSLALVGLGDSIGRFVMRHPTLKVLALSFLLLIGSNLLIEAFHFHIPKGYTYFAMFFSITVELLNLAIKARSTAPVILHTPTITEQ